MADFKEMSLLKASHDEGTGESLKTIIFLKQVEGPEILKSRLLFYTQVYFRRRS